MAPKFNDTYSLERVFTPANQARLTFVERDAIRDKLVDALKTPGKQIVVYGPTGSGKSTLVNNKLRQVYVHHVTSRCYTGLTFEQIVLTPEELGKIVHEGERLLNFRIAPKVRSGIVKYSNGLASICHQLCLNICFAAGINETLPELMEIDDYILEKALQRYLDNASDTLKDAFDKAFRRFRKSRFDNCRLILQALVRCGQDGTTAPDIFNRIKRATPDYPRGNLRLYLKKLQTMERGALIRFDPVSGKYSFSDPIYFAFALTTFEREKDFYLDIDLDKENLIKSIKAIVNPPESVAIGFGSKKRASSAPEELEPGYDEQLYIDKE